MPAPRQGKMYSKAFSRKMDLYLFYVHITTSNQASSSWQNKSTFNSKSESTFQLRLQNPVPVIKPMFPSNNNFKIQSSSSTPLHICVSFSHQHNFITSMPFIFLGKKTKPQRILSNKINITQTIKDGGKIWLQLSLTTKLFYFYYIKALTFFHYSPRPFGWTGIAWLVSR